MKTNILSFILLSLSFTVNYAQTGPGGVGDQTSNILWLDASQLNLNNNDPVSSWSDVSGNSNHATQAISGQQPLYQSSGINGKPALRFDGVNDYLELTNHINLSTQSFFMVFENKGTASYAAQISYCSQGANIGNYYASKAGTWYGGIYHAGSVWNNTPWIYGGVINGSASSLTVTHNGSPQNYTLSGSYNSSVTKSIIGGNYRSDLSPQYRNFSNNLIAEAIVYNIELNEAQQIIVNNYLAAKYQKTIVNDKYAFDSGNGYEVAGIGMVNGTSHTDARGTSDIRISNPTALSDGDFLMWGHDNNNYNLNYLDLPPGFSGARWNRLWRIDERNDLGNYDVRIYLNSNSIGGDNSAYYIIYDQNNNIFSDGGTGVIGPGTYDAITNSVLFSGVKIPDNAYFTLANNNATITSAQTGTWNDPNSWTCNCIPDSTMNVIILNTHNITLNTYQSISNITINSGGTLTMNHTLSIHGNLQNDGTITANAGSALAFNSNTLQTIYANAPIQVYDLVHNNSYAVLLNNGTLVIHNSLRLNAGLLQNGGYGNYTLFSDATATAYLAPVASTASIGGNFRVKRYIGSRPANWSDIGSPTQSLDFKTLDQTLYFSGINGDDGNATDGAGNIFYSAYAYNASTQQYDTVKFAGRILNPTEGFEIWLADDQVNFNGNTIYTIGIPNYGDISANSYLPANSGEWALISNPYASWIAWANVTKSGLPNEVWIFDATSGNYVAHNTGTVDIPPMQGFWVQSNANNPSATFTESCKLTSTSSTFYRMDNGIESFKLILTDLTTGYYHEARIRIDAQTSEGFDIGKDVTLLPSKIQEAPNLTFMASGKNIMVNYFNGKDTEVIMPLHIAAKTTGTYQIDVDGLDYLSGLYSYIELIDYYNNNVYDLTVETAIPLFLEAKDYTDRFALRLSKTSSYDATSDNDLVYVSNNKMVFNVDIQTGETIQFIVLDMQGKIVASESGITQNWFNYYLPETLPAGAYMVRIIKSGGKVSNHKVIVE